jgi:dihydropyrimidine dehydrogenase (NAD+) subunit PreT
MMTATWKADELPAAIFATHFAEMQPSLTVDAALGEANRCLYCYDAPCTQACPAAIDVASFIRKITTDNLKGAARVILNANVLGATCARVCPVEKLCEGACVMLKEGRPPIAIGRLQRYVCDWAAAHGVQVLHKGRKNGKRVAVVGAGPASLACAAELAKLGYGVTVFEAQAQGGGLATYGIVDYHLPKEIPLAEVALVKSLGVEIRTNQRISEPANLWAEGYAAIFLGLGLEQGIPLEVPGAKLAGVVEALDFIQDTKAKSRARLAVGRQVAVLGGGNTALDAAVAAKRLGAAEVTVYYRRTANEMPAYSSKQSLAKEEGVTFRWLAAPQQILGSERVEKLVLSKMCLGEPDESGRRRPIPIAGSEFEVPADMVIVALGQTMNPALPKKFGVRMANGLIQVDDSGRTSNPKVFAGGDCVNGGREVVFAVAEGKRAAQGIDRLLQGVS